MSAAGATETRPGRGEPTEQGWVLSPVVLLLPLLAYLVVFLVWPMARMAVLSLYKTDTEQLWVEVFTLSNYSKLFKDPFLVNVLFRTVRVAAITTVLCALLGYPVGYFLARTRSRLRGLYILMVFMPLLVSVVVRSYGWMVLLGDQGVINVLWRTLPFGSSPLPLMYKEYSVIIGLTQVSLPYMTIPLMSAIDNIDPEQEESAVSLGAGPLTIFRRLILPLSTAGLISGSLLVFTSSMSAFSIPTFLGGPGQMSMAVVMYQQMVLTFNWPLGSAIAMLLVVSTTSAIILSLTVAHRSVPRGLRV